MTISARSLLVFNEYPYDRGSNKDNIIYVGCTDFMAQFKDVITSIQYEGKFYNRKCNECIPSDCTDKLSNVTSYVRCEEYFADTKNPVKL